MARARKESRCDRADSQLQCGEHKEEVWDSWRANHERKCEVMLCWIVQGSVRVAVGVNRTEESKVLGMELVIT